MPPWASAAIAAAPWAAVAIVAIKVGGRLLGQVLDIVRIRTMRSARSPMAAYESKDEQWVWVAPDDRDVQPSGVEPQVMPQLRPVDNFDPDSDPAARSG